MTARTESHIERRAFLRAIAGGGAVLAASPALAAGRAMSPPPLPPLPSPAAVYAGLAARERAAERAARQAATELAAGEPASGTEDQATPAGAIADPRATTTPAGATERRALSDLAAALARANEARAVEWEALAAADGGAESTASTPRTLLPRELSPTVLPADPAETGVSESSPTPSLTPSGARSQDEIVDRLETAELVAARAIAAAAASLADPAARLRLAAGLRAVAGGLAALRVASGRSPAAWALLPEL